MLCSYMSVYIEGGGLFSDCTLELNQLLLIRYKTDSLIQKHLRKLGSLRSY